MQKDQPEKRGVQVSVEPGICGFSCTIKARIKERWSVQLEINSGCEQIQNLSNLLKDITVKDLFLPITRNPLYLSAEQAGCHPSCAVPVAAVKATEVAMGTALPQEVKIEFEVMK